MNYGHSLVAEVGEFNIRDYAIDLCNGIAIFRKTALGMVSVAASSDNPELSSIC